MLGVCIKYIDIFYLKRKGKKKSIMDIEYNNINGKFRWLWKEYFIVIRRFIRVKIRINSIRGMLILI